MMARRIVVGEWCIYIHVAVHAHHDASHWAHDEGATEHEEGMHESDCGVHWRKEELAELGCQEAEQREVVPEVDA